MRRFLLAMILNLLTPGSGLIVLGRPWLGVSLAVPYAVAAELVVFSWLIGPAMILPSLVMIAAVLGGLAWLLAQWLLIQRIRFLRDPSLPEEMAMLRRMAEEALARGDLKKARSVLLLARSIDDSDLDTEVLWARLMSRSGSRSRARRAWQNAERLDAERRFSQEIRQALHRLQSPEPHLE